MRKGRSVHEQPGAKVDGRKRQKMWKKREERGKKIIKEEAKGKNKCKIGKN